MFKTIVVIFVTWSCFMLGMVFFDSPWIGATIGFSTSSLLSILPAEANVALAETGFDILSDLTLD